MADSSAASLRAHVEAAIVRADREIRLADDRSYRRFWEGRKEALKDMRLWIARV